MKFISKLFLWGSVISIFAVSGIMFIASKEVEKHTVTSQEILQWYVIPCAKHSIRKQGITDPNRISELLETYLLTNQGLIMSETLRMSTKLSGNEFKRFDKRMDVYNRALDQCKNSLSLAGL